MNELKTKETIMVVEGTEAVLNAVVAVLKEGNFDLLQAGSGAKALEMAKTHTGRIDLVLSSVELPDMTGPDFGTTLKETRPDVHIMFISGFPHGNLLVLNYGWAFIQNSSISAKLLEMVNDVLHTPNKAQSTSHFDTRKDTDLDRKVEAGQTPK